MQFNPRSQQARSATEARLTKAVVSNFHPLAAPLVCRCSVFNSNWRGGVGTELVPPTEVTYRSN